jgi:hypothetical protein
MGYSNYIRLEQAMRKWRISVNWEREYECDDEGDALMQADSDFDLMSEARSEEVDPEEEEESE